MCRKFSRNIIKLILEVESSVIVSNRCRYERLLLLKVIIGVIGMDNILKIFVNIWKE